MRKLVIALFFAAAPASAGIELFNQPEFKGAAAPLSSASSNMNFTPRSVRVDDAPWEICPRPFFGGSCMRLDSTRSNFNLPRAFSGTVRSARPLADAAKASEKPAEDPKPPE